MTNKIQILSDSIASQIAAGEVIERPASIIKELIENSLDAGSDEITVSITRSVNSSIKITDNGSGISKSDLPLTITQHATSKLLELNDLYSIKSLGFRGEALASIASCSRLKITSRVKDTNDETAWSLETEGSLTQYSVNQAAHPVGTTIEVRDLFFNIPVRKRFLKSDKTEFYRTLEIFQKLALSYFDVGFTFISDQKVLYKFPKALTVPARENRVKKIFGLGFFNNAHYFEGECTGLKLQGWLADSNYHRSQSDQQYFFINNRVIRDKLLLHAIRQAYSEKIPQGRHPCYILYLSVDPSDVDVNVHPTKHEVRFSESRLVHQFLLQQVTSVLNTQCPLFQEQDAALDSKTRFVHDVGNLPFHHDSHKGAVTTADEQGSFSIESSSISVAHQPDYNSQASCRGSADQGLDSIVKSEIIEQRSFLDDSFDHLNTAAHITQAKEYFTNKLGQRLLDINNRYLITSYKKDYYVVDIQSTYSYLVANKLWQQWSKNNKLESSRVVIFDKIRVEDLIANTGIIDSEKFMKQLVQALSKINTFGFKLDFSYCKQNNSNHEFVDPMTGELVNQFTILELPQACRYADAAVLLRLVIEFILEYKDLLTCGERVLQKLFGQMAKLSFGRLSQALVPSEQQVILDELAKIEYNYDFKEFIFAKKLLSSDLADFIAS